MSEENHGGDISSGFGESEVSGPVSDEKAEQMLHGGQDGRPDSDADNAQGDYSEQDIATNEQDLTQQQ